MKKEIAAMAIFAVLAVPFATAEMQGGGIGFGRLFGLFRMPAFNVTEMASRMENFTRMKEGLMEAKLNATAKLKSGNLTHEDRKELKKSIKEMHKGLLKERKSIHNGIGAFWKIDSGRMDVHGTSNLYARSGITTDTTGHFVISNNGTLSADNINITLSHFMDVQSINLQNNGTVYVVTSTQKDSKSGYNIEKTATIKIDASTGVITDIKIGAELSAK